MSNHLLEPEVHVIITQAPGVDGAGTPAQLAQIEADLAALLSRPIIDAMADIPDVDVTGRADQHQLIWDEVAGEYKSGLPAGRLDYITDDIGNGKSNPVGFIVRDGLRINAGTNFVDVVPVYGGTGNARSIARSDHDHFIRLNSGYTFGSSGQLSSGTRTLVGETISGLDPNRTYVITGDLRFDVRGQGTGAGRHTPAVTISSTTMSRTIPVRTVSGVDRLSETTHDGVIVTGVSSVTVSATVSYTDGDPVFVTGGKLTIAIKSNR